MVNSNFIFVWAEEKLSKVYGGFSMTSDGWKHDLEEYIKQGGPDAAQKRIENYYEERQVFTCGL